MSTINNKNAAAIEPALSCSIEAGNSPDHQSAAEHNHASGDGHNHTSHDQATGSCCGRQHDEQAGGDPAEPVSKASLAEASDTCAIYRIDNMDCPMEESLIRNKLEKMPGITGLKFNLMQRVLTINHELNSLDSVEAALNSIDMKPVRLDGLKNPSTVFSIQEMDCPTEESLIRSKLEKLDSVKSLEFNLMKRTLKVEHEDEALAEIENALKSLGFSATIVERNTGEEAPPPHQKNKLKLLIAAGVAAFASEIVHFAAGDQYWPLVLGLALAAIFIGGLGTYKKGWIALKNLNLNMNALMSFAVTGAIIIGQWPEAAMVMVLFSLAEFIEEKSLNRARNAIGELLNLTPEKATIKQDDGTWAEADAKAVPVGAVARVKPGERIALDGEIISGRSAVNQAPITGESLPVEKETGDQVFAGTINESGSFEYRVTSAASESTLARIIHAVEEAQGSRAPTQRFVDKFAKIYTPIVFATAVLVGIIPPLLMGGSWMEWAYKALVLLVIACPCALVISTPVSIVSGLAAATRRGILIKGGMFLEQGRKLRFLALDKTGTITHGRPRLTNFVPLSGAEEAKTFQLAASLAARSDHPVSRALATSATEQGVKFLSIDEFGAVPGQGTHGLIDGQIWHLGNHRLIHGSGYCSPELEEKIFALEAEGKSVIGLVGQGRIQAIFAVADTIKESSREGLAKINKLGIKTIMLTGDNEHTAKVIGEEVGINEIKANLMPEDKLAVIEKLAAEGAVGMVGDGINDAPALARADIGFAMGAAGADTAIETADVALMDDDLGKIADFVKLSKATSNVLIQNISVALGIKLIFFVLTFFGHTTMWMAVFADVGTSLMVVANGLRLLKK